MRIQDVLGLEIFHCRKKEDTRTGFPPVKRLSDNVCTLLLVVAGEAMAKLDANRVVLRRKDFLFCTESSPLELRAMPQQSFSYLMLSFRCLTAASVNPLPGSLFPLCARLRDVRKVERLHHAMCKAFHGTAVTRHQECSLLGIKLLRSMAENLTDQRVRRLNGMVEMDRRIRTVLNRIQDRIKEPLRIRHLAKSVQMHPVHFTRLFQKTTGLSPRRYVLERKIEKTKEFMTLFDDTPTSASLEMGFHDYAHFYRTFKRIAGMNPKEYIARFRKGI